MASRQLAFGTVKVFPKGTVCSVLNQHFVQGRCANGEAKFEQAIR
jgi:hypothetical protein